MIWRLTGLAATAALLFAVLVLPNHPGTMRLGALGKFPLELPVILLGFAALRPRRVLPFAVALVLVLTVAMKLADYAMFIAYNRPFDPILDAFLIRAGLSLLADSVGRPLAVAILGGAVMALSALLVTLLVGLRAWARLGLGLAARRVAGVAALGCLAVTIADAGHRLKYWSFDKSPPGTSWTTWLTVKRVQEMRKTAAGLVAFRAEAAQDIYADGQGLFDLIGDRDVLVIFIESYGRASIDNPLYSGKHLATLQAAEVPLTQAGFAMRSGWLTSPTAGGQSWLAHGALASGLWTSDHGRYKAMLTSGRKTLFHLAQEAGFRTNAVMPAITLAWPEAELMGFDQVFPAAEIPYRGERFNWVTMPDQFTLAIYPSLLGTDPRRDFTQIALISSHAPWVPIPPVIPWDQVGDGSVYAQWATAGPSPREVWKDHDRVRAQYLKAVDYALQVTLQHIAALGPQAPLVMLLGDHQAAGFVAGSDNSDVPVHLIAPAEIAQHSAPWGWSDGLIPDKNAPVWRMDAFRNRFIQAFSSRDVAGQSQ